MSNVSENKIWRIALAGNPNCGKSTLFNQLTGLRQKTGNFPGVTVDKKIGSFELSSGQKIRLSDLPGTYSLHPTSKDEKVVCSILANPNDADFPDAILYVADVTNLEKHLLLLTQIMDLGLPVILVLNMMDLADRDGIKINAEKLATALKIPVVSISAREGNNLGALKNELGRIISNLIPTQNFYKLNKKEVEIAETAAQNFSVEPSYRALLWVHHHDWLPFLSENDRNTLHAIGETKQFQPLRAQIDETLDRFDHFTPLVREVVRQHHSSEESKSDKIDRVLTHRIFGPVIFFATMLLVFQAIYSWAEIPMDWIEKSFGWATDFLKQKLPESWATDLLTDGFLAGLSGILVFIPQIALLFFLITVLEEMGYLARVMFMFDKLMQRFGLSGRSIVALISGGACAVPAIMSTRTIGNYKERLATIFVTPFIPCSARLPVYAVLIGVSVPKIIVGGLISLQALVFMGMYVFGILVALVAAYILTRILDTRERSFLMVEMPIYRLPDWKNVSLTVIEKVRAFVVEAGKIILLISLILWGLCRFGPADSMETATREAQNFSQKNNLSEAESAALLNSKKLESSWAGQAGKLLEPAIKPLGYDWKIGIALITSFAAREVFVGTMATIYSAGDTKEDDAPVREKMAAARWSDTGKLVYTLPASLSLLVFYALAMQCMSTIAVVRRETGSWRWPIIQFFVMSGLAYFLAWAVFRLANFWMS
jgi:ferrous iron transport protein B